IARLVPCAFSIALLLPAGVRAQAVDAEAVHWAYSTWFGTGWYRIGDTRDAFAVRYAPRRLVREQSIAGGERHYGPEVRVPVTVGLEHFPLDAPPGSVSPASLASVSVTPEVRWQGAVRAR